MTKGLSVDECIAIARALGDESRVRVLAALGEGELCACHIVDLLGFAPSTVSKHMDLLRRAGLVTATKSGRWTVYRKAGRDASPVVRGALAWLDRSLEGTASLRRDAARLSRILQHSPEARCRKP